MESNGKHRKRVCVREKSILQNISTFILNVAFVLSSIFIDLFRFFFLFSWGIGCVTRSTTTAAITKAWTNNETQMHGMKWMKRKITLNTIYIDTAFRCTPFIVSTINFSFRDRFKIFTWLFFHTQRQHLSWTVRLFWLHVSFSLSFFLALPFAYSFCVDMKHPPMNDVSSLQSENGGTFCYARRRKLRKLCTDWIWCLLTIFAMVLFTTC